MNYETINSALMHKFPELAPRFEEQFNAWNSKDIPAHCFLGDSLNVYLVELLRKNHDKNQIKKIFEFYECLAYSEDERVRDLLQVTLLEYLWDEKVVYENALQYMLPKTFQINSSIGAYIRMPF